MRSCLAVSVSSCIITAAGPGKGAITNKVLTQQVGKSSCLCVRKPHCSNHDREYNRKVLAQVVRVLESGLWATACML